MLLNAFSYPIVEAIYAIFGEVSQPAALFFVDAVYYLPFVLLPCVLLAWKSDENILRLENVPPGHGLMCVLAAVICVPVVNSVTIVWSVILESLGLTLQNTEIIMNSTADLALAVLAMAALPGICEEMLFRGVVMKCYEGRGAKKAVIISALMFATLHGSVQGLPGQFLMGLVLGWIVMRSGSIFTGMMLHTAYNSILIMITYVQNMLPADDISEGLTIMETLGAGGFAAVIVEGILVCLILNAIMRWFRRHSVENLPVSPVERQKMSATEIIVLISGIVTVLYLYLTDFTYLLGYAG